MDRFGVIPCRSWMVATAFLLVCSGAANAQPREPNRWAILVGIDDYIEAQDLKYCGADQKTLRDRLVTAGFPAEQVFVLHDKATDRKYQPTKRNIEKQLDLVLSLVDRGDVVLLSFSGHGVHLDGKSFLAPNDAELGDPKTLIDTKSIYDLLKQCPASLKVMLIDACRNDPRPGGQRSFKATDASTALARSFQEATPEGIVLINSCAPGEISWEEEEFGHGVFMNYVLNGMLGEADRDDNSQVSLAELANYANLNTKLHVARRYNDSQRPFITNESTLDALDFGFRFTKPTITNSIGMKLKLIPAGEFQMGSGISIEELEQTFQKYATVDKTHFTAEYPVQPVRIKNSFYMGIHEVTVGQFRRFVTATGRKSDAESSGKGSSGLSEPNGDGITADPKYNWRNTGFPQADSHPVVNVSWNDAAAFCQWLSQENDANYRLPRESEWEYACRAGTTSLFHNGDDPNRLTLVGNVADETARSNYKKWSWSIPASDGYVYTSPVGQFAANGFGLFDMHGNVYEWCADGPKLWREEAGDASADETPDIRMLRGGSWYNTPISVRSASRYGNTPEFSGVLFGFRVVQELD